MSRRTITIALIATTLLAQPVVAEDTPAPAAPVDPRKTAAELATAEAGARKARAEAAKAEQDVYSSLITAAGTRGTATVNAGAGAVETASVASDALTAIGTALQPQILNAYGRASARVADAYLPKYCKVALRKSKGSVILVSEPWKPETALVDMVYPALTSRNEAADDLDTRATQAIGLITGEITAAEKKLAPAVSGSKAGGLAPAAIVAGLSVLTAGLKTDIDMYGVALSGGDALLIRTVGGQLRANNDAMPIYMPALFPAQRGAGKAVLAGFVLLDTKLSTLAKRQAELGALAARIVAGEADAGEKTPLAAEFAGIGKRLALLRAPVDGFVTAQQAWLATMTDPSKGATLAEQAAAEADIGCIVADGGVVAQIKADVFGGSVYTRKNLWTSFGGTPIFVSAGGVVTFTFLDLQSMDFINSGVVKSMGKWTPIIDTGNRGTVTNVNFVTVP